MEKENKGKREMEEKKSKKVGKQGPRQDGSTTACLKRSDFHNRSNTVSDCSSHETLLHIGLRTCINNKTVLLNSLLWQQLNHKRNGHKKARVRRNDKDPPNSGMTLSSGVSSSMMYQLTVCGTDEFDPPQHSSSS